MTEPFRLQSQKDQGPGRHALDAYYTPPALAEAIVGWIDRDLYIGGKVLEPSAGKGSFVEAVLKFGGVDDVVAVELDDGRFDGLLQRSLSEDRLHVANYDFLKLDPDPSYLLVIGNPPYNEAEAHVRHALKFLDVGGHLVFLLRLAFLESVQRAAFWQEHPASKVYVLSERPSFTGGATDNGAYGVFCWRRGHTGQTVLEVKSWKGSRA